MVLIVAIIGMIIIMVRERNRVLVIETEAQTIHRVQHNGNIVQHHITILSTYGETALSWEEEDFANYHSLRLHIDSMLQAMHKGYEEFVSQSQIDSLRYLLSSKEEHLYQIMQLFHSQNSQEGMQFSHLPAEAQPRTVIRKKKGFTGFLGAKETLEIVPSASTILKTLNKELLSMQEERQESINAYTDSLRNHNKELNRKLRHLITTMNNQTERVLEAKECHLRESYNRSICVISWLIISAIILLVISYLIIQKDLREKARTRTPSSQLRDKIWLWLSVRVYFFAYFGLKSRAPSCRSSFPSFCSWIQRRPCRRGFARSTASWIFGWSNHMEYCTATWRWGCS